MNRLRSLAPRRTMMLSVVVLALVVAGVLAGQSALFAAQGLQNPGFEEGLDHWTVTAPAAGNAAVVGTETPSAYPTYLKMGNATVAPVTGDKMLRIGIPQGKDKHQVRGVTTVKQTFVTETDRLALSFRLFSWEHRDGRDAFVVDIKRSNGQSVGKLEMPVAVSLPSGTTLQDGPLPYSLSLQIDSTGYLDSDWVTVRVADLPVGEMLTLSYTLNTDRDAAHDSWVYVDWWNRAPSAMFEYSPDDPHEGDPIGMFGEYSTDPDEAFGDEVVAWDWTLTRSSDSTEETRTGPELFWIPPNQEDYHVKLTVRDSYGAVGETETVIPAQSFAPIVNAINTEVFPGQSAPLLGRTLDQGWSDEHTLSWDLAGAQNGGDDDDHQAALSSGIVTGTVVSSAPIGTRTEGLLSVADMDDPSSVGTDAVAVRVEDPDPMRYEQGSLENLDALPKLNSDWSYLSYLQSAGDIDLYEVKLPDGADLPAGTEVLASLTNLPADYDLVLLSSVPAEESPDSMQFAGLSVSPWGKSPWGKSPWGKSPWGKSPWGKSPWGKSPWGKSEWSHSPWGKSPWGKSPWGKSPWGKSPWGKSPWGKSDVVRDPFDHGGWTHAPWGKSPWGKSPWGKSPLDGYPLADLSFTDLDGSAIGGTDLAPGELGLDLSGANLKIAGSSANRGLKNEAVLNATELSTTRMFVAVVGHNNAFDAVQPYRLQIETSRPLDLVDLATEGETYEPLVDEPTSAPVVVPVAPLPKTLFVTQRERLEALYGAQETNALMADLVALSGHDKVLGSILSVPGDDYDAWDTNPVSVDSANAVAAAVRASVRDYIAAHPSIEYVVVVGSDDVVPQRRVVDETVISNEGQYAGDAVLNIDAPLFASIYGQFNLTDDYYVDDLPTPWQGRSLYVPDRAVSRLVETPAEMRNVIAAFLEHDGVLSEDTALVTGYDFMADGAAAVANTFSAAGIATTLRNEDDWSGDQLRTDFLAASKDSTDLNAHFTHYAGLSALGFLQSSAGQDFGVEELLTSLDVIDPQFANALRNGLVFSMGCHAGLSVPDDDIAGSDPENGFDPALDFPQAMARQGGVYIANTGYGLGDTEGLAGTEKLMAVFAEDVTRGDYSVGRALAEAKKRYLLGLSAVTTYDEKSSIQFTLYGLPQYELPVTNSSIQSAMSGSGSLATASMPSASGAPQAVHVKVIDGSQILVDRDYALEEIAGKNGTYFKADGQTQATSDRPIQPSIVIPIPQDATRGDVHGLIYRQGEFVEIQDFDPSISRHTTEWEVGPTENQIAVEGWWPAEPASVNTLEKPGALKRQRQQQLVVVPAQFKPETAAGETVMGNEKVYSDIVIELTRSTNEADFTAPTVQATDFRVARNALWAAVQATDASGIGVITITDSSGTRLASEDFSGAPEPDDDVYRLNYVPPAGVDPAGLNVVVQVADIYGNSTTVTGKGTATQVVAVEVTATPSPYTPGVPVTVTGSIGDFNTLASPVSYQLQFGDGQAQKGVLEPADVTVDGAGTATFDVLHTYSVSGSHTLTLDVQDERGARGSGEAVLPEAIVDTVPPTTEVSGVPEWWAHGPVLVTLTAFDPVPGSGVAGTFYGLSGAQASDAIDAPYIDPILISAEGMTAVHFYSVDNAGNRETTRTAEVMIDNTPPVTSTDATSTYVGSAAINFSATDNLSQVVQTRYWLDQDGPNDVTGPVVTDLIGPHTLDFQSRDEAGNWETTQTVTFAVVPDTPSLAEVWVSTTGDDANSGDMANPVQTIQHAINLVADDGTVYVEGGDYNENLSITRSMTIQHQPNDQVPVRVTGTGAGPVATVVGCDLVAIKGLTISGGGATTAADGGGIRSVDSSLTVSECVISGNTGLAGAGLYASNSTLTVTNTIIASNQTALNSGPGGGVYVVGGGASFLNDTIVSNTASSFAGGIVSDGASTAVFNCILNNNQVTGVSGVPPISFAAISNLYGCGVGYSYVDGLGEALCTYGPGMLDGNVVGLPMFVAGAAADYRLELDSPCIDSGFSTWSSMQAPNMDVEGLSRPSGFGFDMGASERQVDVSQLLDNEGVTPGDDFGAAVAIDGNRAVIGAPGEIGIPPAASDGGAVRVYARTQGGWGLEQVLPISLETTNNSLGAAVAISGDTIVAGSPSAYGAGGANAGAVYVFRHTGAAWAQEAVIRIGSGDIGGAFFGSSVAIDGDTLVVGAYGEDGGDGAAYIFTRFGTTWTQEERLAPGEGGGFGASVAISDGTIAASAPLNDSAQVQAGAVYVYTGSSDTWSLQQKLVASDAGIEESFGGDVDVDGDRIVVGKDGSAYIFLRNGSIWVEQPILTAPDIGYGRSVAISGDAVLVGAQYADGTGAPPAPLSGSAYLYVFNGTSWVQLQRFSVPVQNQQGWEQFGDSLDLSGSTALIGAPHPAQFPNTGAGASYFFGYQ